MRQRVEEAVTRLEAWLDGYGYKGYDPYDALNSPLLRVASLGRKWPRIAFTQALFDLRPGSMHEHEFDAKAVEQGDIVDQVGKGLIGDGLAAEGNDKHAATKGVDVRRRLPEPANELFRVVRT